MQRKACELASGSWYRLRTQSPVRVSNSKSTTSEEANNSADSQLVQSKLLQADEHHQLFFGSSQKLLFNCLKFLLSWRLRRFRTDEDFEITMITHILLSAEICFVQSMTHHYKPVLLHQTDYSLKVSGEAQKMFKQDNKREKRPEWLTFTPNVSSLYCSICTGKLDKYLFKQPVVDTELTWHFNWKSSLK